MKATAYVLYKIAEKAGELIEKDNMTMLPCFVIDGAEHIAAHQPEVFDTILRFAEYYVATKKLRIILGI